MAMQADYDFMGLALEEARAAAAEGEAPIGAIVVCDGAVVSRARNRRECDADPTAHAELVAVREAARRLGRWRLSDCAVYVTLGPCPMCAGALVSARIGRLVYGAADPKAGAVGSLLDLSADARLNHRYPVTWGVRAEECGSLLKEFFRGIRDAREGTR